MPGVFIANLFDDQPDAMPLAPAPAPRIRRPAAAGARRSAHWIKVEARRDGAFAVTNSRKRLPQVVRGDGMTARRGQGNRSPTSIVVPGRAAGETVSPARWVDRRL